MKMKKVMALALAAAMAMGILGGCSNTDTKTDTASSAAATEESKAEGTESTEVTVEDISLKVWVPEEDMEITKDMCNSFQAAHPEYNITWDLSVVGVDESTDALTTDPDAAADVFLIPSGAIAELTEAGLLYPITADIDNVKTLYGASAIQSCSKDGLLYGLPSTPNCWFMYYNKSLYTEDEIKSLETMLAKDLGDGVKNFSCTIANSWYNVAFFYAAGCTLFGPDGTDPTECSWNSANGIAAGEYVIDLAANPKYVEDKDGIAGSLFKEGKLGALCSGTWAAGELKEALGDDLGAAALPTIVINGTETRLSNFIDYKCYSVKSNTQAPLAAQLFAEWLGNEENQLIRYQANGTTPGVVSLQDAPELAEDIATQALIEQTNYATAQPVVSQISQYWTPATAFGEGVINGDITKDNLQESLDTVAENITSTLVE